MGRDTCHCRALHPACCFNPRARMGRDDLCHRGVGGRHVSTHAPAWGATTSACPTSIPTKFQPTRPHGARHGSLIWKSGRMMFQPTRPHGARQADAAKELVEVVVSTHAPAWGATDSYVQQWYKAKFQPTRPHGARPTQPYINTPLYTFQPTRPHGARRQPTPKARATCSFNPRARMGRDILSTPGGQFKKVSTHAPAWGATSRAFTLSLSSFGFNPRARMGRDIINYCFYGVRSRFQPTRPHGARHMLYASFLQRCMFQPTRPHGARH